MKNVPSLRPSISPCLIWCKLIAPHCEDAARLVSVPITARDSATGNTLPICSPCVCQMIGVYTPRPLRHIRHSVTSYISITHRGPRPTSPQTQAGTWDAHVNVNEANAHALRTISDFPIKSPSSICTPGSSSPPPPPPPP